LGGLRIDPCPEAAHDVTVHADSTGGDHLFATPATGHTRSSERLLQPDTVRYVGVGVPVGIGAVVVSRVVVGAQGPEPLTGRLRQLGFLLEPARVLCGTAATPARASGPVSVFTAVPPATGPTIIAPTVVSAPPEITGPTIITAPEVTATAIAPPRTAITAITEVALITPITSLPSAPGPPVIPTPVVPAPPQLTGPTIITAPERPATAIAPPRTAITAITAVALITLITTVPPTTGPTIITITEVTTTAGTAAA